VIEEQRREIREKDKVIERMREGERRKDKQIEEMEYFKCKERVEEGIWRKMSISGVLGAKEEYQEK
jgi:hypothetical protein